MYDPIWLIELHHGGPDITNNLKIILKYHNACFWTAYRESEERFQYLGVQI